MYAMYSNLGFNRSVRKVEKSAERHEAEEWASFHLVLGRHSMFKLSRFTLLRLELDPNVRDQCPIRDSELRALAESVVRFKLQAKCFEDRVAILYRGAIFSI